MCVLRDDCPWRLLHSDDLCRFSLLAWAVTWIPADSTEGFPTAVPFFKILSVHNLLGPWGWEFELRALPADCPQKVSLQSELIGVIECYFILIRLKGWCAEGFTSLIPWQVSQMFLSDLFPSVVSHIVSGLVCCETNTIGNKRKLSSPPEDRS